MALDLQGLGSALELSLDTWAKKSRYARMWASIPTEVKIIAGDAFKEMQAIEPAWWARWWDINHNRYIRIKGVTQYNLNKLHQVMYFFLTDFVRGNLKHASKEKTAPTGKKENRRKL